MARRRARTSRKASNKEVLSGLMKATVWIVGVLVSLAVGFGMVSGILIVPFISTVVTELAGWIVVVMTLFGVLIAIIKAAS